MIEALALWLFFLLSLVPAICAQEQSSCSNGPHTLYSRRAKTLDQLSAQPLRLRSPDGKKTLLIRKVHLKGTDDDSVSYRVIFAGKTFNETLLGFNGEVAWAPDSHAFAVTQTEGGGGIGSRLYVFQVDKDRMTKLEVSRPIEGDFGHPVRCDVETSPNTGFISWQRDSASLLVAAEVVPVSICDCSGTYRVYEITIPALKIVRTYPQTEAKKIFWNKLGCELRDADDRCANVLERNTPKR